MYGEVQPAYVPVDDGPSIRHSKVAPASPLKVQVGVVSLPGVAGVLLIVGAFGACVSST